MKDTHHTVQVLQTRKLVSDISRKPKQFYLSLVILDLHVASNFTERRKRKHVPKKRKSKKRSRIARKDDSSDESASDLEVGK